MPRRIAVILAVDIVHYSRHMRGREEVTVAGLKDLRRSVESLVAHYGGRVFGVAGDSLMGDFQSAVEAVRAAVALQTTLAKQNRELSLEDRFELRIGIHMDDVVCDGAALYGDGVNLASRLQSLATPGGICLSEPVAERIRGKMDGQFERLGRRTLKYRDELIVAYRLKGLGRKLPLRNRLPRWTHWAAATLLIGALGIGALVAGGPGEDSGAGTPRGPPDPLSIAVLPFLNLSDDPGDIYFSEGIAEEILNALARAGPFKVASRNDSFRYRGENAAIAEVAASLRVAHVLEGSVRRDGDNVRVTAQLISAADGYHLWSETYDRKAERILAIQRDIALKIADALTEELGEGVRRRLVALPTETLAAYDAYLLGLHHLREWSADGYRRSINQFERAIALDPGFTQAELALGGAFYFAGTHYGWMAPEDSIPRVKAAAIRGMASADPVVRGQALALHADVLAWIDHDWAAAEEAYKRSFELAPVPVQGWALLYSILGRHDEAIDLLVERLQHVHNSKGERSNLAWHYFNARRYREAEREVRAVLALDANFAEAYRVLGRVKLLTGRADDAVTSFESAVRLLQRSPSALSDLAVALARAGRKTEAQALLDEILRHEGYVPPPLIAQVYAALGDADTAMHWLEAGLKDGARGVIFLGVNPLYDPLREDRRFQDLLDRIGLAPPSHVNR